eukprot:5767784-Amphidinium_carterae.2
MNSIAETIAGHRCQMCTLVLVMQEGLDDDVLGAESRVGTRLSQLTTQKASTLVCLACTSAPSRGACCSAGDHLDPLHAHHSPQHQVGCL